MKFLQKVRVLLLAVILCGFYTAHSQHVSITETEPFYNIENIDIDWYYLSVPENWEKENSNNIEIAVAVVKNRAKLPDAAATVFIQGGPGASAMPNMDTWFTHPLGETNDMVVIDIRGTGFSKPRLCPDLGKEFLNILAKNQPTAEDEKEKVAAALLCKQDMLNKGIDIDAYHSLSVAKDLHALKAALGYQQWNVYGVSYGTYMAQVYASNYANDISALVLDSSIPDITRYYNQNTDNYMQSLQQVFEACENDPACNTAYPDLEKVYYQTIADLEKEGITVKQKNPSLNTDTFTFNAEDFKVGIQQALYHKQFIEVIPLLIYQFQERNADALGNLVAAFSSLLRMDYGQYYCVSCNEALPNNDMATFEESAKKYPELKGGLAFYQSDFKVCEAWNQNRNDSTTLKHHDVSNLSTSSIPVLVLAGGYDPITPAENAEKIAKIFPNTYVAKATPYGHTPSFSRIGHQLVADFINLPQQALDTKAFEKVTQVNFVKDIHLNAGISKMGNSFNRFNPIFLTPLIIAFFVMLSFVFVYLIKLLGKKYTVMDDKVIRGFSIMTSVVGILVLLGFALTLMQVAGVNYFILAFGIPQEFNYLFTGMTAFLILLGITVAYFAFRITKIKDRSIVFTVLFSNILVSVYFLYWGVI